MPKIPPSQFPRIRSWVKYGMTVRQVAEHYAPRSTKSGALSETQNRTKSVLSVGGPPSGLVGLHRATEC